LWSFIETNTFHLLSHFFKRIIVPPSVASEIRVEFNLPSGITIQPLKPEQITAAQSIGLGRGENEAMILARDLGLPLIMDDGDAQMFAEEQVGLEVYGSLEFVRGAFQSCLIQRDEFLGYVMSFLNYERANLNQASWASRAQK
jgi:predicted nucleic acid-binding protein